MRLLFIGPTIIAGIILIAAPYSWGIQVWGFKNNKSEIQAGLNCRDIIFDESHLKSKAKLEAILQFKVIIKKNPKGDSLHYTMAAINTDTEIGSLSVRYDEDSKLLKIQTMKTSALYRNKGVGEALFESVLQDFPETKKIKTGALSGTNFDIVATLHFREGLPLLDAIKESPAYKIRAKFGYSKIIRSSVDENDFGFTVKKGN